MGSALNSKIFDENTFLSSGMAGGSGSTIAWIIYLADSDDNILQDAVGVFLQPKEE